jgi:hypothetical protein
MKLIPLSAVLITSAVAMAFRPGQPSAASQRVDGPLETRADLLAGAAQMDSLARETEDSRQRGRFADRAAQIRLRLSQGDLHDGDKLTIDVLNPPGTALTDTFTVRSGQMLQLTGIAAEIPLHGVLRSELEDHLVRHMSKTFQNPELRVTTMVGIVMTGQVHAPGARFVRHDALLRDVVLSVGTITPEANYSKIVVLRRGEVLYDADSVHAALMDGSTIDGLDLISGDEIEVGAKRRANVYNMLQVATGVLGLVFGVIGLTRR